MVAVKQMILAVALVAVCLARGGGATGQARAAIYVVDQAAPGAADSNAGTEERPFKTVQHAADMAKPGDTVYVMTGKYDERVKVRTGGAEGQPITFRAMPRRSPGQLHPRRGLRDHDREASRGGAIGRQPLRGAGQ